MFPNADAGADPAVPAEQGGKGFKGEGWETNTSFDLIGDARAVKGGVYITGIGQSTADLSVYKLNLQNWYLDTPFWQAMSAYVSDWSQEVYGDVRDYGVAGTALADRAAHLFRNIDLARRRTRHEACGEVDRVSEAGEGLSPLMAVRAAAKSAERDPDLDAVGGGLHRLRA